MQLQSFPSAVSQSRSPTLMFLMISFGEMKACLPYWSISQFFWSLTADPWGICHMSWLAQAEHQCCFMQRYKVMPAFKGVETRTLLRPVLSTMTKMMISQVILIPHSFRWNISRFLFSSKSFRKSTTPWFFTTLFSYSRAPKGENVYHV